MSNPISVSVSFMDGVAAPVASKVSAILADIAADDVAKVERGRDAARTLSLSLAGASYGGDATVVTDEQKHAYRLGSEYLGALVVHANKREGELRARWAGGDTSINVGIVPDAARDARQKHVHALGDAWKAPEAVATTADDAGKPADGSTPYQRHRAALGDAWKAA